MSKLILLIYGITKEVKSWNKVMQVLSLELQEHGIAVCPVHPGWVQTDMGGSEADITVQESARGIFDLAEKLTIENSGKFYTWEGNEHEW